MTNKEKLEQRKLKQVKHLFVTRHQENIELSLLRTSICKKCEEDTDLDFLKETVKDVGLLSPISVVGPYKNGSYQVIEGVRRIHALRELFDGGIAIPCYIVDEAVSDRRVKLYSLAANAVHKKHDPALKLKYMELLSEEVGDGLLDERYMVSEMTSALNISERQGRKYKNVYMNAAPKLLEDVKSGAMPLTTADKIIRAAGKNESLQDELASKYYESGQGEKVHYVSQLGKAAIDRIPADAKSISIQSKVARGKSEVKRGLETLMEYAHRDEVQDIVTLCRTFVRENG